MGVKASHRHNAGAFDGGDYDSSSVASVSGRLPEKQPSSKRKVENSVLDDIMGDPEDFRDLAESDAESDGGRWEDAVRAALEHEEAGMRAADEDSRGCQDGLLDVSKEDTDTPMVPDSDNNAPSKSLADSPSSPVDPDCSTQNGKARQLISFKSEEGKHSASDMTTSVPAKQRKTQNLRYFIIKSLNHHNIAKSIEKGIWATQAMNEPVLNEAFETSEKVLLVFSVNMSGHFQGYAQMTSPIGRRRANVWSEANERTNPWGGTFCVDWLRLYDLPFQKTVHLKNPLNFLKPVKISRDCQELTQDVGDALCALIDEGADREGRPRRKVTMGDLSAHVSKRKKGLQLDSSSYLPGPSGSNVAAHAPSTYSPHRLSGASHDSFSSPPGAMTRSTGCFPSPASQITEPLRNAKSKASHPASSDKSLDRERDHCRDRHRAHERIKDRNHSSSSANLTHDEDLLNMTYEEYLQRHGHARDLNGHHQGTGSYLYNSSVPGYGGGWMGRGVGVPYSEDQYSNYIANWYGRPGPILTGDEFYGARGMGTPYSTIRPPDPQWASKPNDFTARRPARTGEAKAKAGAAYREQNSRVSQVH